MKVIIRVEGGMVQGVYTDIKDNIDVKIMDIDAFESGDVSEERIDKLIKEAEKMKIIY